jgi:hypothetical protein
MEIMAKLLLSQKFVIRNDYSTAFSLSQPHSTGRFLRKTGVKFGTPPYAVDRKFL